jgi:hypothetical protein
MSTQSKSSYRDTTTNTEQASTAAGVTPTAFRKCDESADLLSAARAAKNQFDSQIKAQGERLSRHYRED